MSQDKKKGVNKMTKILLKILFFGFVDKETLADASKEETKKKNLFTKVKDFFKLWIREFLWKNKKKEKENN